MCNISSQVVSSLIALLQYITCVNIFSIVRLRNKVLNTIVMMYGFGSKNEGLVFAKIEVNGLWLLFLYRVLQLQS